MRRMLSAGLLILTLLIGGAGGWVAAERAGYCPETWLGTEPRFDSAPYITSLFGDGARIAWWSREASPGSLTIVEAGEDESPSAIRYDSPASHHHVVEVTGLAPGTRYRYTVDGGLGGGGEFVTDPGAAASVEVAVIGDSGTGSEGQEAVAAAVARTDPGMLIHTGDVIYPSGALCRYADWFFEPYAPVIAGAAVVPAIGNHDRRSDGGGPFQRVFDRVDDPAIGASYVVRYGPLHVLVLDSEQLEAVRDTDRQILTAWIETSLRAADRPWSVVVVHRPPLSNQESGPKWSEAVRDLMPLFAAEGVDLVLSGHAHQYERFAPVDGVTAVVTGGGGASLRGFERSDGAVVQESVHHYLWIDAAPSSLHVQVLAPDGTVVDDFTLGSGAKPPA